VKTPRLVPERAPEDGLDAELDETWGHVTVEGFRAWNGTPNGNATAVMLTSTGQRLFATSSQGQ
jgi:hypothetical protein